MAEAESRAHSKSPFRADILVMNSESYVQIGVTLESGPASFIPLRACIERQHSSAYMKRDIFI